MAARRSTSTPSTHVDLTPGISTNWVTGETAQPVMSLNPKCTFGERVGFARYLAAETADMAVIFAADDRVPISIMARLKQFEALVLDIRHQAKERGL